MQCLRCALNRISTESFCNYECQAVCIKFDISPAGIAGVYDIETHYQYEFGRGVAELSTMKRAIGGRPKFQSQSPALILNAACGRTTKVRVPDQATGPTVETPVDSRLGVPHCH